MLQVPAKHFPGIVTSCVTAQCTSPPHLVSASWDILLSHVLYSEAEMKTPEAIRLDVFDENNTSRELFVERLLIIEFISKYK